jgi:hypothetical protein
MSPPTGDTLPSAGSEVLLHNGVPLYGPNGPPSHAPMMRQTYVQIDQAGNVWTLNNWKPDFNIDITSNPGGDGVAIFVGLAPPPVMDNERNVRRLRKNEKGLRRPRPCRAPADDTTFPSNSSMRY